MIFKSYTQAYIIRIIFNSNNNKKNHSKMIIKAFFNNKTIKRNNKIMINK
jgi:hypothetical protein